MNCAQKLRMRIISNGMLTIWPALDMAEVTAVAEGLGSVAGADDGTRSCSLRARAVGGSAGDGDNG